MRAGITGIFLLILTAAIIILAIIVYWVFQNNGTNQVKVLPTSSRQTESTANFINVPELGIRLQVIDDFKDLNYVIIDGGATEITASFSTKSLEDLDKATSSPGTKLYCNSLNDPIGLITRFNTLPDRLKNPSWESQIKQIGAYYYFIQGPQATCSDNKDVQALETKQSELLKQVFKTIQAIQQ